MIYWDASVAAVVRRSAVPPGWLARREFRYLRPGDELNLVAPLLAGEIPLKELNNELLVYLKDHAAAEDDAANGGLIRFVSGLEKLCGAKESKCAK